MGGVCIINKEFICVDTGGVYVVYVWFVCIVCFSVWFMYEYVCLFYMCVLCVLFVV